jgi:uncharacterized membrane protein YqaE (UPF0057 family)
MRKIKLLWVGLVLSVVLFSCSSSNEFARVKYLDKTYAKKQKQDFKPEVIKNDFLVNKEEGSNLKQNKMDASVTAEVNFEIGKSDETIVLKPLEVQQNEIIKSGEQLDSEKSTLSMDEIFHNLTFSTQASQIKVNKPVNDLELNEVALLLLVILAFLLPPLAVYLKRGLDIHFVISLLLTLFYGGFVFGAPFLVALPVIHALLVVFDVFR